MARLWSCGFELQSATAAVEWTLNVGTPQIDTTTKRSGAASYRCHPTATTNAIRMTFQSDTTNTLFHRFYVYIASATDALDTIYAYQDSGAVNGWSIRMNSDRTLELWDEVGGTQIGSDSAVLSTSTWYRIEVRYQDSAGATAQLSARIDGGSDFASATGLTGLAGGGQIRCGAVTSTTCDLYFDDLAINDTTGSYQTSYPGAGSIVHMQPDGAGDNTQWQDDASTTGGTAVVGNINEVTPDDATNYNKRTLTGTKIDDWTCESSSSAGIGSSDTITLVSVGQRAGATNATATNRSDILRIKSASGGTVSESGTIDISVNGWLTHNDGSPKVYQLTSYTDPTTGSAWTPTGTNSLDNMQIGYKSGTSSTTEIRVTTIWALVEYVPSAATGPANLKAVNGLAKASVKSVNGLAMASIKSFNGLT